MKYIAFVIVYLSSISLAFSQNEIDALRYSMIENTGSGRSLGMGGAFGALGADLSSFWGNPGGIGFYKRSEMEFSLAFQNNQTESLYEGETLRNSRANLNFNSFGLLQTTVSKKTPWVSTTFGIAYCRNNNFNQNFSINGKSQETTMLNVFTDQAAGHLPENVTDDFPFGAGIAYQTYLINPIDSTGSSYLPEIDGSSLSQHKSVQRTGRSSETALGFGANYNELLAIGATMAIHGLRFEEKGSYTESDFGKTEELSSFTYNDHLVTTGLGISFKIGFVARVTDWLRAGAAAHSRTYYSMTDSYTSDMTSDFKTGDSYSWESPVGSYNYNLNTPARYLLNAAFIMGKSGIISADYEYMDFGNANFNRPKTNTDNYDFSAENKVINEIYRGVHKVKAGVEWRVQEFYRIRAGAAYRQSPFVNGSALNTPVIYYSGGLGYRTDNFFADFALTYSERDESYYLYDPQMLDSTKLSSTVVQGLLSIGIRY